MSAVAERLRASVRRTTPSSVDRICDQQTAERRSVICRDRSGQQSLAAIVAEALHDELLAGTILEEPADSADIADAIQAGGLVGLRRQRATATKPAGLLVTEMAITAICSSAGLAVTIPAELHEALSELVHQGHLDPLVHRRCLPLLGWTRMYRFNPSLLETLNQG